jgi:enamine deaminase RidA (YjgF/YER057c/UK114 family)
MAAFTLSNPEAVRRAASSYSLAAEVQAGARRLIVSGQVGMGSDGTVPSDPAAQIELAFENLRLVLRAHDMEIPNIVKTTVFLTDRSLLGPYREVRARVMGDHAPASTLLFVAGLASPEFLVEVEAEAVA